MITVIAVVAGAAYSAAYIAPRPWCYIALAVSTVLVAYMSQSMMHDFFVFAFFGLIVGLVIQQAIDRTLSNLKWKLRNRNKVMWFVRGAGWRCINGV